MAPGVNNAIGIAPGRKFALGDIEGEYLVGEGSTWATAPNTSVVFRAKGPLGQFGEPEGEDLRPRFQTRTA